MYSDTHGSLTVFHCTKSKHRTKENCSVNVILTNGYDMLINYLKKKLTFTNMS